MSETLDTKPDRGPQEVGTADAWKARATHPKVTLPSGAIVTIRLPNLQKLIASGELPNPLVEAALEQKKADEITAEVITRTWAFTRFIVPAMLVEPQITEDDVADLPVEDIVLLTAFANRSEDTDAIGQHIGGLDTVKRFRELRGLVSIDEILADTRVESATGAGLE